MSDSFRQKKSYLVLMLSITAVQAMFSSTTLVLSSLNRRLLGNAAFVWMSRHAFARTVQTTVTILTTTGKICDVSSKKPEDAWNAAVSESGYSRASSPSIEVHAHRCTAP